jgi:hypothetical protein
MANTNLANAKTTWKDAPSIIVTIISEKKVDYEGEETSISLLSAKLKGYKVRHIVRCPLAL